VMKETRSFIGSANAALVENGVRMRADWPHPRYVFGRPTAPCRAGKIPRRTGLVADRVAYCTQLVQLGG